MANIAASREGVTAVAIDRDKYSQYAVKWAVSSLNVKNNGIILVHVRTQQNLEPQDMVPKGGRAANKSELQQLFLSYRGFCARKGVPAKEVVLHDLDVAAALADFIGSNFVTTIVLGASNRNVIASFMDEINDSKVMIQMSRPSRRIKELRDHFTAIDLPHRVTITWAFRNPDVSTCLAKLAPEFCKVYAVTKDKVQSLKSASRTSTPSSMLSSRAGSLPDAVRSQDLDREGSWKSVSSKASSSSDGGSEKPSLEKGSHFRPFPPWDRLGNKHVSPEHSVNNNQNSSPQDSVIDGEDLMLTAPQNRHSGSSNYSPLHPNYHMLSGGIRHFGDQNSTTANDLLQMIPSNRPGSNIFSPTRPVYNANLHINFKDNLSYSPSDSSDPSTTPSFHSSDMSYDYLDTAPLSDFSRSSSSSQAAGEIEEELRRLRLELKQTMEMFNSACKEAVTAKNKLREIDHWKSEEARKIEEAKQAQEAALAAVQMERQRCKAAVEAAQMAQHLAELEAKKRKFAEMRFQREVQEKKKATEALASNDIYYRTYSIEELETATNYFSSTEKIGEGGYGPVFKGYLDHTSVAIKVLRPDISQGKKQFNREIEVLGKTRHPHLVLLLGACPEYGCLVYEYMQNGSLEDRLFRKNNTPSIPWSVRFKIAAEIATGLLFLHQTKPEPLVHRDLKPANILLDKNYVSKISDVGLSRLVPASIADSITQGCITAAAGTFCYIDPEYQQTGTLGTKSDLYSLGVILLQIITAKTPMGLSHQVACAIESGKFKEILDPTVKDWPVEETLSFAKLALHCCELRRRDRPDLGSVILPELQHLSNLKSETRDEIDFINEASSRDQSFP